MKLLKRMIPITLLLCAGMVLTAVIFVSCLQWRISSYDAAYRQIKSGDLEANVVAFLGPPHSVYSPGSFGLIKAKTIYRYEALQLSAFPVRWTIGLDASGKVIGKSRVDNGC